MILVTGGTGFIGSRLIERLLEKGYTVRATKRLHSTIPSSLTSRAGLHWIDADLSDYFALKDAFTGVRKVYHCAALVSYAAKDLKSLFRTNVEGTTHIVNLCLDFQCRLLHVSSVAALGDNEKGKPITEKSKWSWNPGRSNYNVSKFEAEREVWRGISEGMNAVIVNPTIVIGAAQGRSESNKIFALIENGWRHSPPGGAGFVDVQDVVELMIRIMEKTEISGESFLLNADNLSYQELFTRYAEIAKRPVAKIALRPWMLGLGWRVVAVLKKLGLSKSDFSKEVARAACKHSFYDNRKVQNTFSFSFRPLTQSFKEIHESLKKTHHSS